MDYEQLKNEFPMNLMSMKYSDMDKSQKLIAKRFVKKVIGTNVNIFVSLVYLLVLTVITQKAVINNNYSMNFFLAWLFLIVAHMNDIRHNNKHTLANTKKYLFDWVYKITAIFSVFATLILIFGWISLVWLPYTNIIFIFEITVGIGAIFSWISNRIVDFKLRLNPVDFDASNDREFATPRSWAFLRSQKRIKVDVKYDGENTRQLAKNFIGAPGIGKSALRMDNSVLGAIKLSNFEGKFIDLIEDIDLIEEDDIDLIDDFILDKDFEDIDVQAHGFNVVDNLDTSISSRFGPKISFKGVDTRCPGCGTKKNLSPMWYVSKIINWKN